MAAELLPYLNRATDTDGNPYSGAKFFFYATGTTTPQAIYTSDDLGTPHANPVVADSGGLFDPIYFDSSLQYRGVLKSADEATTILDVDPINSGILALLAASGGSALIGFLQSGSGAVAETLQNTIRRGIGKTPFQFGAVGDGTTDDAAALQAWATAGGHLTVPAGFTFKTSTAIAVTGDNTFIDGSGTITCSQRIAFGTLRIQGDDCTVTGITVSNPTLATSQTDANQAFGIYNEGDRNRFINCNILDFEMGVGTSAFGEFYDAYYIGNYVRVNGVGPGTPDDASGYGEDRGDGITHWGGRCSIIGNIIVPTDDTDCREGIFVEKLNAFAADTTGVDNGAVSIISGNIIGTAESQSSGGGRFRKGIDCEEISRTTITGNVIRGIAWYGIQVTGGLQEVTVTANTITCDCPSTNANGASWTPARAGINVFPNGGTMNTVAVTGNAIRVTVADFFRGIFVQGRGVANSLANSVLISGNIVTSDVNTDKIAISAADLAAGNIVRISDNMIQGQWDDGIFSTSVDLLWIVGNSINGHDDVGIDVADVATTAYITGNIVTGGDTSIQTNGVAEAVVQGNTLDNPTTRAIVNAGTTTLDATGNTCPSGSGLVGDFGTMTVRRWRGNAGFSYLTGSSTYDPASVSASANGGVSGNITVTGAAAGDKVTASWSAVTQGLVPVASVSAANTVIAGFVNPTGGAIDLASGTMTVSVERG